MCDVLGFKSKASSRSRQELEVGTGTSGAAAHAMFRGGWALNCFRLDRHPTTATDRNPYKEWMVYKITATCRNQPHLSRCCVQPMQILPKGDETLDRWTVEGRENDAFWPHVRPRFHRSLDLENQPTMKRPCCGSSSQIATLASVAAFVTPGESWGVFLLNRA